MDEKVYPIVLVEVVPGMQSDKTLLKFDWSLVQFDSSGFTLRLDFEHKDYVS